MLTKPVADALCRLYLGMSLKDAIDGGKI